METDYKREIRRFTNNLKLAMRQRNVSNKELAALLPEGELDRVLMEVDLPERKDLEIISKYLDIPILDLTTKDLKFTSFGDELRQIRVSARLTQQAVCEVTGISINTIARYENNQCKPTSLIIEKLRGLYGEELDRIISKYGMERRTNKKSNTRNAAKKKGEKKDKKEKCTMMNFDPVEAAVIAANINKYREAKKITLKAMADKLNVSDWMVSKIASGQLMPTKKFANKIASVLSVSPSDLYAKRNIPVSNKKQEEPMTVKAKTVKSPAANTQTAEPKVEKTAPTKTEETKKEDPVFPQTEKIIVKTVIEDPVINEPVSEKTDAVIKEIWAKALSLISDDHEYRKAVEAMFAKLFGTSPVSLEGMPQAKMFEMMLNVR